MARQLSGSVVRNFLSYGFSTGLASTSRTLQPGCCSSAVACSAFSTGPERRVPESRFVNFEEMSADKGMFQSIIADARHRIFGTHIGDGKRSGRKVLRKALVAERIADWYMPLETKADPIFADPKNEQKKQKLATLRRRGKGPPPKGQGKRSKKR
uniref:Small ribosomal subunit protein mS33 n=2 Tax=Tetraselmis sp. GSL018 TaxID=582737 RepID=A0A061RNP6_9CHLO|mmetsp:Transcript_19653/g.46912  ORF Transcript_19653/g.46912 Transcript_19653/m.46912 type:complete len:155 (+) Transcript_19653:155-619(+)